jgi:hypothetical protein
MRSHSLWNFSACALLVAGLLGAAVTAQAEDSGKAARTMAFQQLVSTRYPLGVNPPASAIPPATPRFDFVDSSRLPAGAKIRSAARAANGVVWVITDKGGYRSASDGNYVPLELPRNFKPSQPQINGDSEILDVVADGKGHIWAATTHGIIATDGDQWWQVIDHRDGMPYIRVSCLALPTNGDIWGGTPEGAWRLRDGAFRYFHGKRWLPGNDVRKIWSDGGNGVYLLTNGGTAHIEEKTITLADKAAHYEEITARHNRRGYVTGSGLKVKGKPEKGVVLDASDNDGLWTAIYIGAESLRYAATKDPAARALAKKSLDALLDLERLTGISGFPARAVLTDEEIKAGVTGFDPNETVRLDDETTKIWFRSPVEKNVWCKGDTSSDELDGHYFAWYLYAEYVADAEEKKRIAATCRRVTDNILNHNLTLVGHTGKRTRWGNWHPASLNEDPRWHEERGLNSFEILMYLKVASFLCGDKKYADAYNELIEKHHYLLNTLTFRRHVEWWAINHSDDELGYVTYYPLLMLEKDPARRRILVQSVARTWEDGAATGEQTIQQEKSPFYNFLYGKMTGRPCAVEDAIQSLQDWPWELINWTVTNSHRHDIRLRSYSLDRNRSEMTRVLPLSERWVVRWNSDPFAPDGGDDGASEEDGAAFLFPYWLGMSHGYI